MAKASKPASAKKVLMKAAMARGKRPAGPVLRASGLTVRAKKLHDLALEYHAQEQQTAAEKR